MTATDTYDPAIDSPPSPLPLAKSPAAKNRLWMPTKDSDRLLSYPFYVPVFDRRKIVRPVAWLLCRVTAETLRMERGPAGGGWIYRTMIHVLDRSSQEPIRAWKIQYSKGIWFTKGTAKRRSRAEANKDYQYIVNQGVLRKTVDKWPELDLSEWNSEA